MNSFPLRQHLRNGSLHDGGRALALLARRHRRDSEVDTRPNFDKLLPAHTRDPHALRENLIHDILQHALLACDIERRWLARSRGCGVGAFRVADYDGAAERRWMWMIGEAAARYGYSQSNTARMARTFSWYLG